MQTAKQAWEEQKSHLNTLQSQLKGLNDSREKLLRMEKELKVFSPVQGVVLELPVKTGQWVSPGLLLSTLATGQDLEIKADILSDDLPRFVDKKSITAPFGNKVRLAGG